MPARRLVVQLRNILGRFESATTLYHYLQPTRWMPLSCEPLGLLLEVTSVLSIVYIARRTKVASVTGRVHYTYKKLSLDVLRYQKLKRPVKLIRCIEDAFQDLAAHS